MVLDVFYASTVNVSYQFIKSYDILVHILDYNQHPHEKTTTNNNNGKPLKTKRKMEEKRH